MHHPAVMDFIIIMSKMAKLPQNKLASNYNISIKTISERQVRTEHIVNNYTYRYIEFWRISPLKKELSIGM